MPPRHDALRDEEMRIPWHFLVLLLVLAVPASAQRLPDTVRPVHYTLWFAPDLARETFRGTETIRVQLVAPASSVTLHAVELELNSVAMTAGGRTQTARVTADPATETVTLTVPQEMPAGTATIEIAFTGTLNAKLRGFYISHANGRKYAVTQMEATDARRAFPSFDEPAYKATFDISLQIADGDVAISNGKLLSDRPGPDAGTHTVAFATTPKMSTYLVAMLVGDFVCREGAADGTPIRVCSTPDQRERTAFALEATRRVLAFYNDYFGLDYPFGKLDIIAVPDFAAGAMENTGAIMFRERLLLVDPVRGSPAARKQVAAIISHEIAHQWFGNLVTMKWWDDIWLNEGFATWMANKPLADWRSDWRTDLDDVEATQAALGLDALRSTRPIRTRAETPQEINELFDAIAYEKTGAVLRMIEAYVGPADFRAAVRSYIRKYSYSNAAGEDFWNEVTRVTGKPVDLIMKSFVDQPGAPVISAAIACHGSNGEIALSQERFSGSPAPATAAQHWTLPACLRSATGRPRCALMDQPRQTFRADSCSVVLNGESRGYCFSQYAEQDLRTLVQNVKRLSDAEQFALLGDEWWMVRGGRHDVDTYLDLAQALAASDTPQIVDAIATRLLFVADDIVDDDDRGSFEAWIRTRFGPILLALGLPGGLRDSDGVHGRRASMLGLVGTAGNDAMLQQQARELVLEYVARPSSVSATLAPTLLQVAAVHGDRVLYDLYMAQLEKHSGEQEESYRYLNALPWFQEPSLVARTLDLALSPSIRTQDVGTLIAGVMQRPSSREATWELVRKRWSDLIEKLGTFQGIPAIVTSLGSFCSIDKAAEVRQFFAEHPLPSSERTVQQAVERIESCAGLRARQAPALARWLSRAR